MTTFSYIKADLWGCNLRFDLRGHPRPKWQKTVILVILKKSHFFHKSKLSLEAVRGRNLKSFEAIWGFDLKPTLSNFDSICFLNNRAHPIPGILQLQLISKMEYRINFEAMQHRISYLNTELPYMQV